MGVREEQFGKRLKALREARGQSQGQLLKAARSWLPGGEAFDRTTLSRLENGHQWPRSGTLQALAKALGVSVEYLMGQEEGQPSSGPGGVPLPEPEFARVLGRLNALPRGIRERVALLIDDLMDVLDEAGVTHQSPASEDERDLDLGFEPDARDRELDALMRESGLNEEARAALWRSLEERTRSRRLRR